MSVYKISSEGVKAQRRQQIRMQVLIIAVALLGGWYVYGFGGVEPRLETILPVAIVIIYITISTYFRIRKVNQALKTFEIEITENTIIRRQENMQELSFSRFEISNMAQTRNGVVIRGEGPGSAIIIPSAIDDYDELLVELEKIRPFDEADKKAFHEKYWYLGLMLFFGGIAGYNLTNDKYIAVLSIGALLAFLWLFIKPAYQNRLFSEEKRKRAAWIVYIVTVVFVIGMIIKLFIFP
ncbi:hypothetical protein ACE38W_20345 [Chitinophaga sp. Hz27]|uniref:hypothetical protein n=1 Tax=Chitinophaga sp. Hz27 TaxID=3347169 RepID=UPI0035D841EB